MALSKDDIRIAAERLDQAEKTIKQIRQISLDHPDITIDDSYASYAIQKAWIAIKVAQGRLVKGHKIGLTSKAMQSALNIDELRPTAWRSKSDRWCWRDRSFARSKPAKVTRSRPTMDRTAP
jgi:hypothetical protein